MIVTQLWLVCSLFSVKYLIQATQNFERDVHAWITLKLQDKDVNNIYPANSEGQRELQHKSSRVLIHILRAIPEPVLQEISPGSMQLRKHAKVPLVMLGTVATIESGFAFIFIKFAQSLLNNGSKSYFLMISLAIIGALASLTNLHFVNLSMRYYDQTDVVPILSASMLIAEMLAGLIVGDEFHLYNGW